MRRVGVAGPRQAVEGFGGCGQGKLRRKEGGREEEGEEAWEVDCWLRREVVGVGFLGSGSGSGWCGGERVARGQMVGVGSSKIVRRRLGWREEGRRELGLRVGVSGSGSGVRSSSL